MSRMFESGFRLAFIELKLNYLPKKHIPKIDTHWQKPQNQPHHEPVCLAYSGSFHDFGQTVAIRINEVG